MPTVARSASETTTDIVRPVIGSCVSESIMVAMSATRTRTTYSTDDGSRNVTVDAKTSVEDDSAAAAVLWSSSSDMVYFHSAEPDRISSA